MQNKKKQPQKSARPKNTSVQYIVWTQNGQPLPKSVAKRLDDAMQRIINDSKVPLLATVVQA